MIYPIHITINIGVNIFLLDYTDNIRITFGFNIYLHVNIMYPVNIKMIPSVNILLELFTTNSIILF